MNASPVEPFTSSGAIPKHPREISEGEGGIACNPENPEGTWAVIQAFVKKISGKILSGKFNFSSMQRPSLMSLPITHLQLIANEFACIKKYVEFALEVKDPLERVKLIAAGMIGNLAMNVYTSHGKGPVNPTLGETLCGAMQDGSQVYLEQISMHPHTTLILIIGPQNKYKICAKIRVE